MDKVKMALAVALVIAGVWGYYHFSEAAQVLRVHLGPVPADETAGMRGLHADRASMTTTTIWRPPPTGAQTLVARAQSLLRSN